MQVAKRCTPMQCRKELCLVAVLKQSLQRSVKIQELLLPPKRTEKKKKKKNNNNNNNMMTIETTITITIIKVK